MASLKTIKNKSIKDAKRIVIKIGSSLIINNKTRNLNYQWMKSLAENIDFLIKNKKEVLIVTSGAIALGKNELNLNKQSLKLHEKQACAATGQILLAKGWKEVFEKLSLKCAQILVGHSDLETRRSAMNARVTLNTLLKLNTIPVINENDTVATIEIRYGDNDQLAGRVAHLVGADLVILLSDVEGLYTGDPKRNKKVKFISKVEEISEEIEKMAKNTKSFMASGGMATKIKAAKIALSGGCNLIISEGSQTGGLLRLIEGGKCTLFKAKENPQSARKKWISSNRNKSKNIVIDNGAESALISGNSLLPAGIIRSSENFKRGETIEIVSENKKIIGCGIVAYDSEEVKQIAGKKSKKIIELLGYKGRNEVIHYDDMVLDNKE